MAYYYKCIPYIFICINVYIYYIPTYIYSYKILYTYKARIFKEFLKCNNLTTQNTHTNNKNT